MQFVVVRRRLGDDADEFHCRHLLQHDHRLHTALSVRFVHHDASVAILQTGVDAVRVLRTPAGGDKQHRRRPLSKLDSHLYVKKKIAYKR